MTDTINKIAILKKKDNKKTKKQEWALVSKSKPSKVLVWFGTRKPSKQRVNKEEKRVQFFKHQGEEVINNIHKVSSELYEKGIIHIADVLVGCIESLIKTSSRKNCAIKLGKIIHLLQKKGEADIAERLDSILPDVLTFEKDKCDIKITGARKRMSAKRAYNIAKILEKKYLEGEIDESDFEYTKMGELKTLLKSGFVFSMPTTYKKLPTDVDNWWDHFSSAEG
jgi:hypothetical protein